MSSVWAIQMQIAISLIAKVLVQSDEGGSSLECLKFLIPIYCWIQFLVSDTAKDVEDAVKTAKYGRKVFGMIERVFIHEPSITRRFKFILSKQ